MNLRALLLALLLLANPHVGYASESNFAVVNLPRGISLEVPKGWWLIGEDLNRVIETSVEAALDLSGIGVKNKDDVVLIAANSRPTLTYAAVRVTSTIPPTFTPEEVRDVSTKELKELETETIKQMEKLLPMQGNKLIEFIGYRKDSIGGYPALVAEYRRTGPKGSVFVQINQVATPTQTVTINLSYRESEAALWSAVIAKMRISIAITRR
jgi:hypothetical protein